MLPDSFSDPDKPPAPNQPKPGEQSRFVFANNSEKTSQNFQKSA
jgi:hypothetical protein